MALQAVTPEENKNNQQTQYAQQGHQSFPAFSSQPFLPQLYPLPPPPPRPNYENQHIPTQTPSHLPPTPSYNNTNQFPPPPVPPRPQLSQNHTTSTVSAPSNPASPAVGQQIYAAPPQGINHNHNPIYNNSYPVATFTQSDSQIMSHAVPNNFGAMVRPPPTPNMSVRSAPTIPASQTFAGPQRIYKDVDQPKIRKILSLDGGGIRGLSTIMILKSIMRTLEDERGYPLEPWQEFDMIGGTSTGGLLAIMLGRLRMSVHECQEAYIQLSRDIFTRKRSQGNVAGRALDRLQANGRFSSEPLEENIQNILRSHGLNPDELLKETDPDACKVFVCTVRGGNGAAAIIRSYRKLKTNDNLLEICKIWEAARATSAASTFFEPIKIGPLRQEFVDGALRHNNPIDLVDSESTGLWPGEDRIIISIGTGSAPGRAVTGYLADLVKTLKDIVTDTEEKNRIFRGAHAQMVEEDRLFRFNVYHGLADVGLEEYENVHIIADFTDEYLEKFDTMRDVVKCVNTMKEGGQRLNYVGGEG
ncbi:hypothetical protein BP5796_12387 [Coleophoma crateriformis]|uniref:PNPLA domain-containing protein n=1 Tax=Coleophoma crateriformis TaxID=565419 RepID=A0A3D8Q9W8_9HELO|nr:hypothetical protein BP5796_12387 [Coleophoma crateriformis]